MSRISGIRRRGGRITGSAVLVGTLACGTIPVGASPERPEAVIGQWELSLAATSRKCRLALRAEVSSTGARMIALPYGCRKAFPILADLQGWSLSGDGRVEFLDAGGTRLLGFTADSAELLTASGPQGEIYRLTAAAAVVQLDPTGVRPAAEPVKLTAKGASAVALRPSDIAGRYAVLREGGKDTGCMVTLDDKTPAKGGSRAYLAPACRDQGIVIFDPAAWRIANGRLVLTARKGHTTELDLQSDGTWLKNPTEGKSLGLKKL